MGRVRHLTRGIATLGWFLGDMPRQNLRIASAATDRDARILIADHYKRVLALGGVEFEVSGREHLPDGGCVIVYNEPSLPDMMAMAAVVFDGLADRAATVEAWTRIPFARRAFDAARVHVVRSGDRAGADAVMTEYARLAADGARIAWGGEGRLAGKDEVGRFKRGCALIAIRGQVPVVPLAIRGGHRLMPLGSVALRPGTVRLQFGPPVSSEGLGEDDAREFADRLQAAVTAIFETLPA